LTLAVTLCNLLHITIPISFLSFIPLLLTLVVPLFRLLPSNFSTLLQRVTLAVTSSGPKSANQLVQIMSGPPVFVPTIADMRRALDVERQAREANRHLGNRLREEMTSAQNHKRLFDQLAVVSKRLVAEMEEIRDKDWDLQNETKQVRRENEMLDAENNQLREDN